MPQKNDQGLGGWAFKIVVGLLLSTTCFMTKRLIEEQDRLREIVWQLRQDVVVLKYSIDQMHKGKRSE